MSCNGSEITKFRLTGIPAGRPLPTTLNVRFFNRRLPLLFESFLRRWQALFGQTWEVESVGFHYKADRHPKAGLDNCLRISVTPRAAPRCRRPDPRRPTIPGIVQMRSESGRLNGHTNRRNVCQPSTECDCQSHPTGKSLNSSRETRCS